MAEKYIDYFNIDPEYFPQVNEAIINKEPDLWKKFYPHESFVGLIRDTISVVTRKQKVSIWVEGAYGTGKSHAVLTLKKLLDALRPEIHGMVHCSGGAQTKVLHFVENVRVVKDNLFPVPPLFKTIQEQSGTDWAEMYKVFNMGHRLEVYLSPEHAEEVIAISESFGIPAQIVGRIEACDQTELIIKSEFGEFRY